MNKFRDWLLSFLRSRRGIAALEMAICLPLFVILFYEYWGFAQNLRLLSDLERATASLGDVLANPSLKPTDNYIEKVVNGDSSEITKDAIGWAFEQMVGRAGIHGVVRISYSDSKSAVVVRKRKISVNPDVEGDCTARNQGALDDPRAQLPSTFEGGVLVVDACIKNPVKDFSFFTDIVFPEEYSSTFVAPRRK